jgi:DNA internalization-related competence protein ComEC/Rec2
MAEVDDMAQAQEGGAAPDPLGASWRAALALGWVAGVALQLQQAVAWEGGAYRLVVAGGLALVLAALRRAGRIAARPLALAAALALGFGCAGWQAAARLADALAPEWEGRDVELVGVVDELPQLAEDGERFAFAVESARAMPGDEAPRVPSRVWLSWSTDRRADAAVAPAPAPVRAGQRWRLRARLRRPHGAMNPEGFDAELWLFEQGLRATGSVRAGELVEDTWAPIERLREQVRDRLLLAVPAPAAGTVAALAVGDQAAIDGAGWEVFRDTGVAHLMSISGLHITMLGWLGGAAIGALWRRSERAALRVPAPSAARWGGVAIAWVYALVAGWGVPARRTVVMLASTAWLRGAGLDWPAPLVAIVAMVPVTALDPWALLQPGFWLSFAAVGLLMVSEPVRAAGEEAADAQAPEASGRARRLLGALVGHLRASVRAQAIATVGLAPLTLVAFQQVSLVGLLANLVAEPWVTLVVVPLALVGIVAPPAWTLAALALEPLLRLLDALGRWPLASVHVAAAPAWALAAGLAGGAVLVLQLPWRVRALGLPLLLPLVAPFVARPPAGRFELVAADVGQGSAVLVRTHAHLLLFDAGPRFGGDNDAGRRVLLPLLRARGEPRIDALVLSHADADHVGGAQAIVDRFPVLELRSSLADDDPLLRNPLPHVRCAAGQAWTWDGVRFAVLHPLPADYRPGAKTNAVSCVLRVVDADGRSALLTGDIEAPQEAALAARAGTELRSDILLVPHHGSRTSSTETFLDAVRPRVAVIQVGYRSRYGHPAPEVVARYAAHGIAVVRTDRCGAWTWQADEAHCTRTVRRRYWHWQDASPPPVGQTPGRPRAANGRRPLDRMLLSTRWRHAARRGVIEREEQGLAMDSSFDEMHAAGNAVRAHYQEYARWLARQPAELMRDRRNEAEMIFRRVGITFAVYGDKDSGEGTERLIPFDQIPRVIPSHEWREMEKGLRQRVTALNRFIHDIYHGQEILKAGVVPVDQIAANAQFRPEMRGVDVPGDVYSHIAGIDIVRAANADGSGTYYVLEDNLRVPSGVSYMLENRKMMMRLFPELFSMHRVAPVAHYPDLLLDTLRSVAPGGSNDPTVVVLTPGMYNSAYFEHAFLAQQMGVELVEGQDLFVKDDYVFMRTTQGPKRVDVIYRRVDDDFLDPEVFRKNSTLGCAGLLGAYKAGSVTLANAIGTGVADDKSIYAYVPKMIEFYLGEKPILNNVPTWLCREPDQLSHVLANLGELVVKEVHGAGGYGMLVGPASTKAQIEAFRARLLANPANYIAQPTLSLSTCPTFVDTGVAPRHIDLRPFVLSGQAVQMVPGGLTRVALQAGSLVVNSSQGGGTKDTWVLEGEPAAALQAQSQSQAQSSSSRAQAQSV